MKKAGLILASLVLCVSCVNAQWWGNNKVKGNGNVVNQERSLGDYDAIHVAGNMNVQLISGAEGQLKVVAEENLQEHLITEVDGGKLIVKVENGYSLTPSTGKKFLVIVPFKDIKSANLSGSGAIVSDVEIKTEKFKTSLSGSGDMKLLLATEKTYASVTGSGDVMLKGNTNYFEGQVTGSGDLDAEELLANNAEVNVTGSGDMKLYAKESIKAKVTGSGDIDYYGNPEKVNKKVTGSGDITSR